MNLSLIDPFILAQDYPDALTGKIRMTCYYLRLIGYLQTLHRIRTRNLFAVQPQRRFTCLGQGVMNLQSLLINTC